MNMIVVADENWGIGFQGKVLINIPREQKQFREETQNKVVVMGRKTLETYPQGLPLVGRKSIILSRNKNLQIKGAIVVHSVNELLEELKNYASKDIYIVGGESVFKQMLPYCDTIHVTKVQHSYQSDSYFPDLDHDTCWKITADSEEQTYFDIEYVFLKYQKKE